MKIIPIVPHGFCAGVAGAIRRAHELISAKGREEKIYCLHELVHNELVVATLRELGVVFVESVESVPSGATVLFSAHGVSPAVRQAAMERGLRIEDATCPFVDKVHRSVRKFVQAGLPVVVIGNPSHAEVCGIVGEAPKAWVVASSAEARQLSLPDGERIGVVSQTTMNSDAVAAIVAILRERYAVETLAEVCNATKVRQDAVRAFEGDAVLVLGSANSSNTRRLCECVRSRVFRAATIEEVRALDFAGVFTLGVTSGASTPEDFYNETIELLKGRS